MFKFVSALLLAQGYGSTVILGDSWGEFVGNARPNGLGTSEICVSQTVHNQAVGGASAQGLAADFLDQAGDVPSPSEVTRVWLTIGGNDYLEPCEQGQTITFTEIETRVRSVILQTVSTFPNAEIALTGYTTPPSSCGRDCWPVERAEGLDSMYRQLADENANVTYFNIHGLMGGSAVGDHSDGQYYQDCIHLNDAGYINLFKDTSLGNFMCPLVGVKDFAAPSGASSLTAAITLALVCLGYII